MAAETVNDLKEKLTEVESERDTLETALGEMTDERDAIGNELVAAREENDEFNGKLQSGYSFCHPDSNCKAMSRYFALCAEIEVEISRFRRKNEHNQERADNGHLRTEVRASERGRAITYEYAADRLADLLATQQGGDRG